MSIREFLSVAVCDTYSIASNGCILALDPNDPLMMEAYGDFLVEKARFFREPGDDDMILCEITVQTKAMRKGVA